MNLPRRAVVTGGAGFIGSHLVDALLARDVHVTVVDNFATGRAENLAHVADRIVVERYDVNETERLRGIFEGVETVFHLAGLADIVPSIERPSEYFRANVDGTQSVMEAARAAAVQRVVYAASSSCYGIPDSYPTPESAEIRPQYPYALTKYLGELVTLHWSKVYRIPAVSLRLFNVFGVRSRTSGAYGSVFGVFLAQKLAGKPFTVVGDGTQSRDFTYVTDVARAFVAAGESDVTGKAINIGSGRPQTVNRLVELLGGEVANVPRRPGEPDSTHADATLATRLLNWQPEVSFEEGVQRVLDNIDYWRAAPVWDERSISEATKVWFEHLGEAAPA
jgi:UDP-glucose 4-epimerase